MAKIYDLSEYLSQDKPKIKIGENEFIINDGFNDLLKIDALTNRREEIGQVEFVKEFLNTSLGEESTAKILSLNLPAKALMRIVDCIQSAFTEDDEDEKEGDKQ
jgi:hypothetical protein